MSLRMIATGKGANAAAKNFDPGSNTLPAGVDAVIMWDDTRILSFNDLEKILADFRQRVHGSVKLTG